MEDYYQTSDLGIITYLCYARTNIIKVDPSEPGRMMFVFDISKEIGQDIQKQWWNGTLRVEPHGYFVTITQVKDRIYAKRREMQQTFE